MREGKHDCWSWYPQRKRGYCGEQSSAQDFPALQSTLCVRRKDPAVGDFSNPNGEAFDPEGIPQKAKGCPFWMGNHPIHDRGQNV